MIIDGKKIASQIREELKFNGKPILGVFKITDGVKEDIKFATEKFISIKKKFADSVGVEVVEVKLSENQTTESVIDEIKKRESEFDGIIVQFPLPNHIDMERIRNVIPSKKDIDVLGDVARRDGIMFPPVVGAFKEILDRNNIKIKDKIIIIIGKGELVGKPAKAYFEKEGGRVSILDRDDEINVSNADILVLGAGSPGLIKPEMIKEGVVILDAGTSEDKGKLAGDADPQCAEKASLFTPVPGGIGPITIAVLFKNLLVAQE